VQVVRGGDCEKGVMSVGLPYLSLWIGIGFRHVRRRVIRVAGGKVWGFDIERLP
jgi:hypothetical protein